MHSQQDILVQKRNRIRFCSNTTFQMLIAIIRLWSAAMATSFQLFQSVKANFQFLGIFKSQPSGIFALNWRIILALFWYIQHLITVLAFFIFEAKTVLDYGVSFYGFISMVYCVYYFLILIWQRPRIFQLIENFHQFIKQSKCFKIKFWMWKNIFNVSNCLRRRLVKEYIHRAEWECRTDVWKN